ncbi:MAG: hypothetical protein OXC83_11440 [Chloroflexi bacterium]|nr:hypothetical protein [Chloroflexota bacterium]
MRWLRPIPQDWIPWHLVLFMTLCVIGLGFRAIEELPQHQRGDAIGFTNTMVDGAVSVILVAATISTTIVEGAMIFAERYLKHRYERGREEGIEEGKEEGREAEQQRWADWMARKQHAEEIGEEFSEPSPLEVDRSNGSDSPDRSLKKSQPPPNR